MPTHELTIRKAAEADLEAAIEWYEQERSGLGDEFLAAVENSLHRIRRGPRSYPRIKPGFQCALVERFPYVVYFRVEADSVVVFAVLHGRRDPQILEQRMKSEKEVKLLLPTFWLGHARDARDLAALHELGIRAVIDLAAEEPPAQLSRDLVYLRFPLLDGDGNPDWLLQSAVATTARLIEHRVPTLVACSGGMSRSPAVVAAALARLGRGTPEECLKQAVTDGPQQVSPALWNAIRALTRGATADRLV